MSVHQLSFAAARIILDKSSFRAYCFNMTSPIASEQTSDLQLNDILHPDIAAIANKLALFLDKSALL